MSARVFPPDFLWGCATAAYQIEGAVAEDGRGPSIWDTFSHTPGCVAEGHTGDVACDHYHRYEEDLNLLRDLGVKAYRFSVAWPRIQPQGKGAPHPRGLDFYQRLVDGLLARDIRPVMTLYHWDLPQALQDEGGWGSRDTAARFAEYAAMVVRALGDRVPYTITHNEPWCTAFLGHALGTHAPGRKDPALAIQVAHHVLLSHGWAVQAARGAGYRGQMGITLNLTPVEAAGEGEEDRAAAVMADGLFNRWFLEPVLKGRYPEDVMAALQVLGLPPRVADGDMEAIRAPVDFLGVNYYTRTLVKAHPGFPGFDVVPPAGPVTDMGWEVVPGHLGALLRRLAREYPGVPVLITENGAAYPDRVGEDGTVHDPERVAYLHDHLEAVHAAMADGADVRGYFVWSLMDNFEWNHGYTKRFGLYYTDYPTQRRIPKDSAAFYRDVVTTGRLP